MLPLADNQTSHAERGCELSIIVATHNRADLIAQHVASLASQTVAPTRFEVLVADDGSRDNTMERLNDVAARVSFRFHFDTQANAGAGAARNRAIARATGNVLLFVNDDTLPDPALVEAHLNFHSQHPGEEWGAVGRVRLADQMPASLFTKLHHAQWDSLRSGADLAFSDFITANVSIKRAYLARQGGFATELRWHEDVELGRRLVKQGLRLRFLPAAIGYHHHAIDEGEFRRMARRDGEQLVAWYRRDAGALDDLTMLGLAGPTPFRRTLRQRMSALLVSPITEPAISYLARATRSVAPMVSLRLWRAIFVYERRRSILKEWYRK